MELNKSIIDQQTKFLGQLNVSIHRIILCQIKGLRSRRIIHECSYFWEAVIRDAALRIEIGGFVCHSSFDVDLQVIMGKRSPVCCHYQKSRLRNYLKRHFEPVCETRA